MDTLRVRGERSFSPVRSQEVSRKGAVTGVSQSRRAVRTSAFTISDTLRQLMTRVDRAETRSRESGQVLRTGEGVLAEVQNSLERIAELARQAAGGGSPDRSALQAEMSRLGEEIDRMARGAVVGEIPLFLDEELDLPAEELPSFLEGTDRQEALQTLPDWLVRGLGQEFLTPEQLLAGLGLDRTASGAEILAALADSSLDTNAAAGYIAALYLGAVIAGLDGGLDPEQAAEGLSQLMEKLGEGLTPDQAVELLTDGLFSGLADFQAQVLSGGAPGLQEFLEELLLSGEIALFPSTSLLALLAGMEGMDLELMMGLLTALQGAQSGALALSGEARAPETAGPAAAQGEPSGTSVLQLEGLRVTGRDLSGVIYDAASGVLTVGGRENVTLRGTGPQVILLTGSGTVTLQEVEGPLLTVESAEARIVSLGENVLGQLRMERGSALSLEGGGLVQIGRVSADGTSTLRMAEGALILEEQDRPLDLPVVLEGTASLAARAGRVSDAGGTELKPFDVVWKTLLPGWSSIASISVDGRQGRMTLLGGDPPDPVRLWINSGESGSPVHNLTIRGRDSFGKPKTRYAYLLWNQYTGSFQEAEMYPNPFLVTGGEEERDWSYEQESQTLRILSDQVTAVSGGSGMDANQAPFSGRMALADGIGAVELALGGVVCQVPVGRAFDLGRENSVTLILRRGTENLFHSGVGCAGISLGDGTSLCIDCDGAKGEDGEPAGTLTAAGGAGGAGIGRDRDASQDQASRILIRGGEITASGTGGGAGIGAGQRGPMGSITISGGRVTSTGGSRGGAGIGGALGAPAGDISIKGGAVTAVAVYHAAAIGAGVQGECGDIRITGTAQIVKAVGGNPGADIGACLFGRCGRVWVLGGADLGSARLWTQKGVDLHMGEDTVTLPQFPLSARALRLNRIQVSTREYAQAAGTVIEADRRWVAQIQSAYHTLYSRLERSFSSLHSVHRYINAAEEGPVRDSGAAGALLRDMNRSILGQSSQAMRSHSRKGTEDVRQLFQ